MPKGAVAPIICDLPDIWAGVNPSGLNLEMQATQALARLEMLRARNGSGAQAGSDVAEEALEQLSATLEELRVACESNREQSDALVATRDALAATRARFEALFDLAPDGYLVTDGNGRIQDANVAAAGLLRVARRNLVGKPMTVFIALARRAAFRGLLHRLAKGQGATVNFEARLVARGGHEFDAAIRVTGTDELRWTIRDVTEQRAAERALRQSEERYRDLSSHLHKRIEDERARIAREVHDELGAALTAVRLELANGLANNGGLSDSISRIDEAIRATRRICADLRPSLLDHLGLWAAIEWMVEDLGERTGIRCTAELERNSEIREPERATAVFRIVQEALTNALRHASASSLRVTARSDGGELMIEVRDDGSGIRETELTRPNAFGIIGMQERARMCGGRLSVEPMTKGTRVSLRVPMAGAA